MMKLYISNVIVLIFCFHILAQEDSCQIQKELAKRYASHTPEKDRYFLRGFLLGTAFPLVGPLAVETHALAANVTQLDSTSQSITKELCFQNEYAKRVKVERSEEVLKGGLLGTGVSVVLYGILAYIILNTMVQGFSLPMGD